MNVQSRKKFVLCYHKAMIAYEVLLIIQNLSSKKHFLVNCFQKIPASPERISIKIHPCSMDSPRECAKGGQMRRWTGLPQTHCGSHKSQHSQSGENEKCLQGIVVLQRPT